MKRKSVFLLGEDAFCLSILERIMACSFPGIATKSLAPAKGVSKLKSILAPFATTGKPLVVLADSDNFCPVSARLAIEGKSVPNVLVRIAVREADAWVLGDAAIADFLDAPVSKLARQPELLTNPKEELIQFAGYSKNSAIRRKMTRQFAHQSQPSGYNELIPNFVQQKWNPVEAALRCPSLKRTLLRLRESPFLH